MMIQTRLPTLAPQSRQNAKPFLKWAGGKTQLLEQLKNYFPPELDSGQIRKYAEPFVGSGAVFFFIAQNYPRIEQFYISDINCELVIAYKTIRQSVEPLIEWLREMQAKYFAASPTRQQKIFYEVREQFNSNLALIDFDNYQAQWVERTGQIIFLNRTCFNGLFRVNSKGEFNVPFGRYKKPLICAEDNLRAVSDILQRTEICSGDFEDCRDFVDDETLVYFDPPYRPISQTASFTSYSSYTFDDTAQERLADFFRKLDIEKRAKLILSNSDPKNLNDKDYFLENLYASFQIKRVRASRMINSDARGRGKINELLIMNYTVK